MKYILSIIFVLIFYTGCSNKNLSIDDQIEDSVEHINGLLKYVDFFDSDGKTVRSQVHYLDTTDNHWLLTGVDEYRYNESGQIVRQELFVPNLAMKISPLELDSFFYNGRGLKTELMHYVSCGKKDSWTKVSKIIFSYLKTDTAVFSESQYVWDDETKDWHKWDEKYYEYDSLGRVVSLLTYQVDPRDTSKVKRDYQEFYYPDSTLIK